MTWRRKGFLAANVSHLSPAEGPPPEAEVPKRCPATIPFSSLSRFSLLHIDVDVEESGTHYRSIRTRSSRFRDSFFPKAVSTLNTHMH
ncbi:unnamed protein product [Boreogadus saida]